MLSLSYSHYTYIHIHLLSVRRTYIQIAVGKISNRRNTNPPFIFVSNFIVDKIQTQLAKATSLGGGRPAHTTNGRPLAGRGTGGVKPAVIVQVILIH